VGLKRTFFFSAEMKPGKTLEGKNKNKKQQCFSDFTALRGGLEKGKKERGGVLRARGFWRAVKKTVVVTRVKIPRDNDQGRGGGAGLQEGKKGWRLVKERVQPQADLKKGKTLRR